jgi:hypothetical protein
VDFVPADDDVVWSVKRSSTFEKVNSTMRRYDIVGVQSAMHKVMTQ